MIDVKYKIIGAPAQTSDEEIKKVIFLESQELGKRMSESYANHLKTTITRVRAIATGDTLKSVRSYLQARNPTRMTLNYQVSASRSIVFIQQGRRPGKAPIRLARINSDGKKEFEPLPGLIRWFLALNIPKALWMPIARAIGRRGIKPREVQKRAINAAQRSFKGAIEMFLLNVAKRLFKPAP